MKPNLDRSSAAAEELVNALDELLPDLDVVGGVLSGVVQVIVNRDGVALSSTVLTGSTGLRVPDAVPTEWTE